MTDPRGQQSRSPTALPQPFLQDSCQQHRVSSLDRRMVGQALARQEIGSPAPEVRAFGETAVWGGGFAAAAMASLSWSRMHACSMQPRGCCMAKQAGCAMRHECLFGTAGTPLATRHQAPPATRAGLSHGMRAIKVAGCRRTAGQEVAVPGHVAEADAPGGLTSWPARLAAEAEPRQWEVVVHGQCVRPQRLR
jgi:hypothetical protein